MADNYLEKRYEEVFGSGAARKGQQKHSTPSLNTLLVRNRSVRRYRQDFHVTMEQLRTIAEVNTRIASAMNRQALRFRLVTSGGATAPQAEGHLSEADAIREILFREQVRPESATAFIVVYTTVPEDRYIDIDLGISLQSMALKATELGLNCLIKWNIDVDKLRALLSEYCPGTAAAGACRPGLMDSDDAEGSSCGMCSSSLEPLAVLCIGKAAESVFLKPVAAETSGSAEPASDSLPSGVSMKGESARTVHYGRISPLPAGASVPASPYLVPYTKDGVHYVPKLRLDDILLG